MMIKLEIVYILMLPLFCYNLMANNLTRGYNYTYDKADRLTNAQYLENKKINNNYSTSYTYDHNGNITSLTRRGKMSDGTYNHVDNLTLTYNGNQLTKVTDAVKNATSAGSMDFTDRANVDNEYTYDANGNMTRDLNKGITSITYNVLNLPAKVTFSNGVTVMYTYDANGNKLKTIHKSATKTHTTEYCGNHIYEDGNLTRTLFDGGYITYKGNSQQYHYHITDHQGNIRLVVNASGSTVEQFTHYYPYGLPFAEGKNATLQPYKYNGKELDTEDGLNLYDYGARHYDAAICRWNAVDALAEKYPSMGGYVYCAGNPIMFIDPDGNSIHWVESKTGNVYWDDNAISESTTKAGEKYLGPEGYGINEANGNVIHYGANGIASEAPMGIGDISVSGDKDISAVRQSVYQSQRDFLTHPITQAAINTMLFVATGGVEGLISLSGAAGRSVGNMNISIYRVFGGDARAIGNYWTPINPKLYGTQYRNFAGLPNTNTGTFTLKATTPIRNINPSTIKPAAPLDGNFGRLVPELKVIDKERVVVKDFWVNK